MNNDYEVRGETTVIFLDSKGSRLECLIDTSDLPMLIDFPYKWQYDGGYVVTSAKSGVKSKQKKVRLHRFLLQDQAGLMVDHINGNKIDNRRENLRSATSKTNNQNRFNTNNVYLDKRSNLYYASVRLNRKCINSIYFKTFEEAREEAIKMRSVFFEGSQEALIGRFKLEDLKLQNKENPRSNNKTSGIRGISLQTSSNKWRVKVKGIYRGQYDSLKEAKIVLEKILEEAAS